MASVSRWERLRVAAIRLREIQREAQEIYRSFPELDGRPKRSGPRIRIDAPAPRTHAQWPGKFH